MDFPRNAVCFSSLTLTKRWTLYDLFGPNVSHYSILFYFTVKERDYYDR